MEYKIVLEVPLKSIDEFDIINKMVNNVDKKYNGCGTCLVSKPILRDYNWNKKSYTACFNLVEKLHKKFKSKKGSKITVEIPI